MVRLLPLVESELEGGCTLLWSIGRHVSLLTPSVEDGNNFGVDVQASCLKTVQDKEVRVELHNCVIKRRTS